MRREQIYAEIVQRISNFTLEPGKHISENEIAKELGVSRTPVREVFIRLANEKLIEVYPQSGTYISKIDLNFVQESALMRHILEKEILFSACDKPGSFNPSEFEKNFSRQREAIAECNVQSFLHYDNVFHRLLFSISGHETIWDIIEGIKIHYLRFRYLDMSQPHALENIYKEHMEILNLIKQSDKSGLEKLLKLHHFLSLEEQRALMEKYPEYFINQKIIER